MEIKTGIINAKLPDDLEDKFRTAVFNRFGMKKDNLNKAIEEAVKDWINEGDKKNE